MAQDIDLEWNEQALRELARSPGIRQGLLEVGSDIAAQAARDAPKRTGGGAGSIHAEADEGPDGVAVNVSWDRDHFYLAFHELGTVRLPARPFLRPAVDRYVRLKGES